MPRPAAADRNAMLLGWKGTCSGRNISAMEKAMEKRPWKLIANVPGIAGKPGVKEYYVVRAVDEQNAIVACALGRSSGCDSRASGPSRPSTY
jgi:hypothetical protein